MINREQIYSALFDKIKNIGGFKTSSRKLLHWNDVPAGERTVVFQIQKSETPTQSRGIPTVWNLSVLLYLYVNTQGQTPSIVLNDYLDKIEEALKPNFDGFQTLGGLVSHCWISGAIETDEGVLGEQGVAIIPIDIRVAN